MRAALLLACLTLAATAPVAAADDGRPSAADEVRPAAADEVRPAAWMAGAVEDGNARLEGRLLLHPERSDDGRLRAGVLLTLDPGWHVAWQNPGDAGRATRLRWHDADAGPVGWPAPSEFPDARAGLARYGYAGDVLLTSELHPHPGATRVEVEVEALVCREACIPARLSLARAIGRVEPPETAAAVRRLFARHAEALPKSPRSLGVEPTLRDLGRRRVALLLAPCQERAVCRTLAAPRFAPASQAFRVLDASDGEGELVILLEREPLAPRRLTGVLSLTAGDGRDHHLAIDLAPGGRVSAADGAALAALVAFAFALGLLMNGTPSHVVRLEAAFAEAEAGRRAGAVAFTAGVATSALCCAALAVALRAGARGLVGPDWPGLAVVAALLCTLSASNLFEVFAIPSAGPASREDRAGFRGGLLALWRGWPCALPLLVPALALALFTTPRFILGAALALGLGYAAPQVFLFVRPGSVRPTWLPQPGPWSIELRRTLGFLPLAGAAWLVARVARGAGAEAAAWLLWLLLLVALVLWASARLPVPRLRGVALALGLALAALVAPRVTAPPATSFESQSVVWRPETFERLRAMHRPVLVVFTADWCPPCRWNEQAVVASSPVRAALARGGYTVLRADWTGQDEAIRRELARFGRAGVPLTLLWTADADRPERLPDVLTAETMLAALGTPAGYASLEQGAEPAPSEAE